MCAAVLIDWDPATPLLPPHLDSYTRALLVRKDRRHLFVTPEKESFWGDQPIPWSLVGGWGKPNPSPSLLSFICPTSPLFLPPLYLCFPCHIFTVFFPPFASLGGKSYRMSCPGCIIFNCFFLMSFNEASRAAINPACTCMWRIWAMLGINPAQVKGGKVRRVEVIIKWDSWIRTPTRLRSNSSL